MEVWLRLVENGVDFVFLAPGQSGLPTLCGVIFVAAEGPDVSGGKHTLVFCWYGSGTIHRLRSLRCQAVSSIGGQG